MSEPSFKCFRNFSHTAAVDGQPWDWREPMDPRYMANTEASKAARTQWLGLASTHWLLFCPYDGVNPNMRISEHNNPPVHCMGLVADIDTLLTREELEEHIRRLDEKVHPNLLQKTPTRDGDKSKWRLVWVFEKPLRLGAPDAYAFVTYWAAELLERDFKPLKRIPGFDEPSWLRPTQPYVCTADWIPYREEMIDQDYLEGLMMEIGDKYYASLRPKAEYDIPLDAALTMLCERYPNMKESWAGIPWTAGAAGPSFWIPGSTSPKSALVCPTGMRSFAAHATQPFYSWAELLGADAVKQYVTRARGARNGGFFFDNVNFWRKMEDGRWRPHKRENVVLVLRKEGASRKIPEDREMSQVEEAITDIVTRNYVDQAAPELFKPEGFHIVRGSRRLNTSNCRLLLPADTLTEWGKGGGFPFLSLFFDTFFDPCEGQLEVFLAWFQWFYTTALNANLQPGQVLVLAGPPNCGKTFCVQLVIGNSMGGVADANGYLSARTDFNSELFQLAVWSVDDTSLPTTDAARRKFTDNLKRVSANYSHKCNPKFEKASEVSWFGRPVVTQNIDPESLRQLPDLSSSSMDKIVMLRCAYRAPGFFPARIETERTVAQELPYFLRWLVDGFKTKLRDESDRFGMKAYHHPDLYVHAVTNSSASVFYALLTSFLWANCKMDDGSPPAIRGNALTIWEQMCAFTGTKEALKSARVTYPDVQHHLEQLVSGTTENQTLIATVTGGNNPEYTIIVKK